MKLKGCSLVSLCCQSKTVAKEKGGGKKFILDKSGGFTKMARMEGQLLLPTQSHRQQTGRQSLRDRVARVLAPLGKEQLRRGGSGSGVYDHDAALLTPVALGRGFKRLHERASTTKLGGDNDFSVAQSDVSGGRTNCSDELLRFGLVDAGGAGLHEHSALGRHCLYQLQTQVLAATSSEHNG
jgi:hypothetical protein